MDKLRLISLVLAGSFVFTGCSSKDKAAAAEKPPGQTQEEYVRYTPTGSWVSKKVKKSAVTTEEQQTADSQQALEELRRHTKGGPPKPVPGG